MEPRGQDEPIALVIPRWVMETWLHHYLGRSVKEAVPKVQGARGGGRRAHRGRAGRAGRRAGCGASQPPAVAVTTEELRWLP